MCKFKSGEGVFVDGMVEIKTVVGEDSHIAIRETHGIREDHRGLGARYHTPLEFIPVRGLLTREDYDLVFDAGKPEWWTDELTQSAKRQFWHAVLRELRGCELKPGRDLNLGSLTSLPERCELKPGGNLYLESLTSLPERCELTPGGNLYLRSLTLLPERCELTPGRGLYLRSRTSLPERCELKPGGNLYLPAALQERLAVSFTGGQMP